MAELTVKQKRCEDCACLVNIKKTWCCDELWGKPIEEIDECPEGFDLEEIEEIQEKAEKVKIQHGAKAESEQKTRKTSENTRNRGDCDEKEQIFNEILPFLQEKFENVEVITKNNMIHVKLGEETIKINLIRQTKKG